MITAIASIVFLLFAAVVLSFFAYQSWMYAAGDARSERRAAARNGGVIVNDYRV